MRKILLLVCLFSSTFSSAQSLRLGAERTEAYIPLLAGKRVGVVANASSRLGQRHLVDSLLSMHVNLRSIFCPEHGFRGEVEAGAFVDSGKDSLTGLPLVSLYGKNKKPTSEQLKDLDCMIFDLQDVGVRFYTYISTLHYVMEACAEAGIPLIVLDRPNPNGHYIDGPLLEAPFRSFVGMHPVPMVHGMTMAEYARMINGERWLQDQQACVIVTIAMENYDRKAPYSLPVPPSPNLPTDRAVALYPSLCLFEGTPISLGRGTDSPFELFGHPSLTSFPFVFTPRSLPGKSQNPPCLGQQCSGRDLRTLPIDALRSEGRIQLQYLLEAYASFPDKEHFFIPFFDKLAGTDRLRQQIQKGMKEDAIRQSWQEDLRKFKDKRSLYLLYE